MMGIVATTPPDPSRGVDRTREAAELLRLGYLLPAAFSGRAAIEEAVRGRLFVDQREKGHQAFDKLMKRVHRGYRINGDFKSQAVRTYRRLSEFLHGEPHDTDTITQLIDRAETLRDSIASADVRPQF